MLRDGVKIAALGGIPAHVIHSGIVSFIDPFTNFGNLVVIDHGANMYSLYRYLGAVPVTRSGAVDSGIEIGLAGSPPAGPAALYLEIHIDGRSVNPVEWLEPR